MATVLLLTATYVKDYTFIDPNVDEKYIRISKIQHNPEKSMISIGYF